MKCPAHAEDQTRYFLQRLIALFDGAGDPQLVAGNRCKLARILH